MDAVQRLRARAQAAGNLKSTPEQTVTVEPAAAAAQSAGPPPPPAAARPASRSSSSRRRRRSSRSSRPIRRSSTCRRTTRPSSTARGPTRRIRPYSYYPPGYVAGAALFSFAAGVAVGAALWGNCNWGGGDVNVNVEPVQQLHEEREQRPTSRSKRTEIQGNAARTGSTTPSIAQGAQYRDTATQQRYNRGGNPQATQSRESFRGRAEQGRQDLATGWCRSAVSRGRRRRQARPEGAGAQPAASAEERGLSGAGRRRRRSAPGQRPGGATPAAQHRGRSSRGQTRGAGSGGGSAFQGAGAAVARRGASDRGQASRQSMGSARRAGRSGQSRARALPSGARGWRPAMRLSDAALSRRVTVAVLLALVLMPGRRLPLCRRRRRGRAATFASPEEAVTALVDAIKADDQKALLDILGPEGATAGRLRRRGRRPQRRGSGSSAEYDRAHRLAGRRRQGGALRGRRTISPSRFRWSRTAPSGASTPRAGKEEILNRRIGQERAATPSRCAWPTSTRSASTTRRTGTPTGCASTPSGSRARPASATASSGRRRPARRRARSAHWWRRRRTEGYGGRHGARRCPTTATTTGS